MIAGGIFSMSIRGFPEAGISDYIIMEARDELGGRMLSAEFAG
jgi:monoamine oxidase